MKWKWLEQAQQFDKEPSGGGAEDPPEPAGDGETGSTEPITSDDSGMLTRDMPDDPAPEPEPEPEPKPTPEPEPIGIPDDISGIFRAGPEPPSPETVGGVPYRREEPRRQEEPAPQAPPKPTGNDWLNDPEEAQAKLDRYMDWAIQRSTQPLTQKLEEITQNLTGLERGTFEATRDKVERSVNRTEEVVANLWGEKGFFNQDAEFRNNPEVQKHVKNLVSIAVRRAMDEADRTGRTERLDNICDEVFAHRVLHAAKGEASLPSRGLIPQATPAGPQPPAAPQKRRVSAEDAAALAAAKKDGRGYSEKQIAEARKKLSEPVV